MTPHIKILILNWNGKRLLKPCLDSVTAIDYPNYSVMVIDNGSSDGSLDMVKRNYPDVECMALGQNYGFAGGYNRCFDQIEMGSNDYLSMLNNDTKVASDIVSEFIKAKEHYGNNQIYGGKIFYMDTPDNIWYAGGNVDLKWGKVSHRGLRKPDSPEYSTPMQTEYITGCCLLTSTIVINQLNGFDERFNMYGEDVDLCLRAKKEGINCYYWPDAKLWHHVSASINGAFSLRKIIRKYHSLIKLYFKHN